MPLLLPPTRTLPEADVWLSSPESVLAFADALSAFAFAESATDRAAVTLLLVEFSCFPVTASVLVAFKRPSATLTIRRLVEVFPTENEFASVASELAPMATEPLANAFA